MDPMQLLGWLLGTSAALQTFLHTWASYLHSTSTSFFCFIKSKRIYSTPKHWNGTWKGC